MEFEWDNAKAARNLKKHGIAFAFATLVFEDPDALEEADFESDFNEARWILVGLAAEKMLAVVYTVRGAKLRIISARKADPHERERYENR